MIERINIAKRAADELTAARNTLERASVLFGLVQVAITSGDLNKFSAALTLVEIGSEITSTYADRADDAADFFAGVIHG